MRAKNRVTDGSGARHSLRRTVWRRDVPIADYPAPMVPRGTSVDPCPLGARHATAARAGGESVRRRLRRGELRVRLGYVARHQCLLRGAAQGRELVVCVGQSQRESLGCEGRDVT